VTEVTMSGATSFNLKNLIMRTLLFILSTLCIFSCGKDDVDPCTEISLGESVVLNNNELVCIDGTEYTFTAVDDRCPCDTICAWEGEFLMTFEEKDGTAIFEYHTSPIMESDDPIIGEIFNISISAPSDCGAPDEIDEVLFTVAFQ